MIDEFRAGGFQPPSLDVLAKKLDTDKKRLRRLVTVAVSYGELAQIDASLYLAAENDVRLREIVADVVREKDGATVADIRERLNSTRKFVVPFLEYLDRSKYTVRQGDLRVLAEEPTT